MRRFILGVVMMAMAAIAPAPAMAGDQEVAQQIADTLRGSGQLVDYSVGVKYQNGTAWLLGRVSSPQQMAVAVGMTEQLPFVKQVVNQLEIQPTANNQSAVRQVGYPASSGEVDLTGRQPVQRPQAQPAGSPSYQPARNQQVMQRDDLLFGASRSVPVQYEAQMAGNTPKQGQPVNYQGPTQQGMPTQAMHGAGAPQAMPVSHGPGGGGMPMMQGGGMGGGPIPYAPSTLQASHSAVYDNPQMPCYAWPSYAAHPNYAAVTYPTQYSASAWPYIGPFYPYPQVPLGWRKVTLEWDDGWWFLDFSDKRGHGRRR